MKPAITHMLALATALLWLAGLMPAAAQAPADPCNAFGVQNLVLTGTQLPVSFSGGTAQTGADCMAWQEFISLNWKADPAHPGQPDISAPASSFGAPEDTSPKVWESYFEAATVFNPPSRKTLLWTAPRPKLLSLSRLSEFGAANLTLSGISQAGSGKWLTNQRGGLTYYDVFINQDEFDYITTNQFNGANLTTFAGQLACASQQGSGGKGGLNLPGGGNGNATAKLDTDCTGTPAIYGQNVGAIEVKAAWTILPADHSLDYRYLTAIADVITPGGKETQVTIGLVGLHILHKVPGAQQFVWATFEQIDNDPDDAGNGSSYSAPFLPANPNQKPSPGYTYFNPSCTPQADPYYGCVHNKLPGTPCNLQGQPAGCDPYSAPMQVTRLVPVDNKIANPVTGYAWSLLPAASVFNYYRLIDVQWPSKSTYVGPGTKVPLTSGSIVPDPSASIVANTTLETFEQDKNACTSCHVNAPIAQKKNIVLTQLAGRPQREVMLPALKALEKSYASDYSFLFVAETTH
jgi:hypothetical protein